MTAGEPILRPAARVLLVDARERLLLFEGCDPAEPELGWWWFTPGGGLDPGETPAQGAARELSEETGLRLAPDRLVGPVCRRVAEFGFQGRRYRQAEDFFLARVPAWEVDVSGFTDLERVAVRNPRWWTLPQLRARSETVYPADIADWLPELLTGDWSGTTRLVQ